jgi:hypothetical protein
MSQLKHILEMNIFYIINKLDSYSPSWFFVVKRHIESSPPPPGFFYWRGNIYSRDLPLQPFPWEPQKLGGLRRDKEKKHALCNLHCMLHGNF